MILLPFNITIWTSHRHLRHQLKPSCSAPFSFLQVFPVSQNDPPPWLRSETSEFSLISLLLPIPRPTHPVGFISKLFADWAHFWGIFAVITLSKLPLSFTGYYYILELASSLTLTPSWELCLSGKVLEVG